MSGFSPITQQAAQIPQISQISLVGTAAPTQSWVVAQLGDRALLPSANQAQGPWMHVSGALLIALVGTNLLQQKRRRQQLKQLKFEHFKGRELKKKLKMALKTISLMEKNPDLVHSRDFNLDYLRMRMEEDTFNFAVLNNIRVRIKDTIAMALRPRASDNGVVGIPSTGRQIDETFDVSYVLGEGSKKDKRVLFRIQVRLIKLPTQASSQTIQQLINCIEAFLSPTAQDEHWQPMIQGRLAHMQWDQLAKPTPLLVLEQTQEGSNVTFRTRKQTGVAPDGTVIEGRRQDD
jgi:hypothetical protein